MVLCFPVEFETSIVSLWWFAFQKISLYRRSECISENNATFLYAILHDDRTDYALTTCILIQLVFFIRNLTFVVHFAYFCFKPNKGKEQLSLQKSNFLFFWSNFWATFWEIMGNILRNFGPLVESPNGSDVKPCRNLSRNSTVF